MADAGEPSTTVKRLLSEFLVVRSTRSDDAADRYYCHRSKRTLWVEPEPLGQRSSRLAPRYLVDDGEGTRTYYVGDDLERAITRLLSVGRQTRRRVPVIPARMAPPPGETRAI